MLRFIVTLVTVLSVNINLLGQSENSSTKLFDDTEVAVIRIKMNADDLQFMYNFPNSDSVHLADLYLKNAQIEDSISSVGIRLRGNTSRTASKKSFKISFNSFIDGGEFYSVEKLNLNGEQNDPTRIRSKLCWDLYKDMEVISPRAAHTKLYINDKYYGLYTSVEHIDDEFIKKNFKSDSGNLWKCLHPASLAYIGDEPDLYKYEVDGERSYSLKTNKNEDDYTNLARLINILNNTPDSLFIDSLSQIIRIDDILKYYTMDIMTGSWDDYWYGWNNYYLYFNPEENKFRIIPYDYDNTFGVDFHEYDDWATRNIYDWGNVDQPAILNQRILSSPELRNLLTHYLSFYSNNVFDLPLWESRADSIFNMISPIAPLDPYKDWGFSNLDFFQSYDSTGFYYHASLKIRRSIKEFVNERNSSIVDQFEYLPSKPIIYKTSINKNILFADDSLTIKASIFSPKDLATVIIEIENDGVVYETQEMIFQPIENSKDISKTDRWKIKFIPQNNWIDGKLKIVATDVEGNSAVNSNSGFEIKRVTNVKKSLVINEVMTSNDSSFSDENLEYDDWLEIYNPSDTAVFLSGKYLTDEKNNLTKWQIPNDITIEANSYKLFWCDKQIEQGITHANFKLSSNGEFLALVESDGFSIIDSLSIPSLESDISYGRLEEVDSLFHYFVFPTPNSSNYIVPKEKTSEVLINELMPDNANIIVNDNGKFEDWIEIYNPQDTTVDLSGRFLTDNKLFLGKWKFPQNTLLNSGEFLLVWCDNDTSISAIHSNFQLNSNGEYIALIDKDGVTIVDSVTFPQINANYSYARSENIERNWEVSKSSTPGTSNIITDLKDLPRVYENKLSAYPNPFNPTTNIEFELGTVMDVNLRIFDILGQIVWSKNMDNQIVGKHSLQWNGKDNNGRSLSSGIYILQLEGNKFSKLVKLMILH